MGAARGLLGWWGGVSPGKEEQTAGWKVFGSWLFYKPPERPWASHPVSWPLTLKLKIGFGW